MGGISIPASVRSVNGQTGDVVIPVGGIESVNGDTGPDVILTAADIPGAVEEVNGQTGPVIALTAADVGGISGSVFAPLLLSGATSVPVALSAGVIGVDIFVRALSTNGVALPVLRLSAGGVPVAAGYEQRCMVLGTGPAVTFSSGTTGFELAPTWSAATIILGTIQLRLIEDLGGGSGRWSCFGSLAVTSGNGAIQLNGLLNAGIALDEIVLTTIGGANAFDAGEMYISEVIG